MIRRRQILVVRIFSNELSAVGGRLATTHEKHSFLNINFFCRTTHAFLETPSMFLERNSAQLVTVGCCYGNACLLIGNILALDSTGNKRFFYYNYQKVDKSG